MSSVIVKSGAFDQVIGVGVVDDEILYLFTILFLVLTLILVVDFGFDIDKGISPIALALSAMALNFHPRQPPQSQKYIFHLPNHTC